MRTSQERNPYNYGTNEYWDFVAKRAGFQNIDAYRRSLQQPAAAQQENSDRGNN